MGVLLVVCDKLQKDNFMTYGAMKSFEHVITRSKSSVIIPQTVAAEHSARDILAASASLYLDDALDRESHTWYVDGVDKKMDRHFTSVDKFLDASHNSHDTCNPSGDYAVVCNVYFPLRRVLRHDGSGRERPVLGHRQGRQRPAASGESRRVRQRNAACTCIVFCSSYLYPVYTITIRLLY